MSSLSRPPALLADWILGDARQATRWLLRQPQPALEAYAVSRRVANRKLDEPTLLEPLAALEAFDAAFDVGGADDDLDEDE